MLDKLTTFRHEEKNTASLFVHQWEEKSLHWSNYPTPLSPLKSQMVRSKQLSTSLSASQLHQNDCFS